MDNPIKSPVIESGVSTHQTNGSVIKSGIRESPHKFVFQIDPNKSVDALRKLSDNGIISPSYPKIGPVPPIGQLLETSPDNTRVYLPYVSPISMSSPKIIHPPVIQSSSPVKQPTSKVYQPVPEYTQPQYYVAPPVNSDASDPVLDTKIRADYRVKFSILREAYPQMTIPDPEDNQTVPQIMEMYKSYVKRIHIDSSVEQNSTYLVIMWLLIEVVGTRFFKFPMKGYFKNQFKYMNKYQMLLIELGERNYATGFAEGWPVEARLLLMALFNGVIFVMVKTLADKMSLDQAYTEEITEMINGFLTKGPDQKKETLRMADEATADNPPVPQPQPAEPLGGIGGLLGNLIGMFGGMGGEDTNSAKPADKPQKKPPTSFGARTRKTDANDIPNPAQV